MYTIRTIPPDRSSDAPGLSLLEAFTRIMAMADRHYMFTRTARVMHMLTDRPPGEPRFESAITTDEAARNAIMAQVCAHGLGRFRVISDEQYRLELLAEELAA